VTIFDTLNDLLFTKKKTCLNNVDDESSFNQYMTNRWISMYSDNLAIIINSTVNWFGSVFEQKRDYYNFLHAVIPRVGRKRIHYIKKIKPEPEVNNISGMAKKLELSQREIKLYYECQRRTTSSSTSSTT
jgi:hypothetical protein